MTQDEIKKCKEERYTTTSVIWMYDWADKLLDHIEFVDKRGQNILQMLKHCEKILDENKKRV